MFEILAVRGTNKSTSKLKQEIINLSTNANITINIGDQQSIIIGVSKIDILKCYLAAIVKFVFTMLIAFTSYWFIVRINYGLDVESDKTGWFQRYFKKVIFSGDYTELNQTYSLNNGVDALKIISELRKQTLLIIEAFDDAIQNTCIINEVLKKYEILLAEKNNDLNQSQREVGDTNNANQQSNEIDEIKDYKLLDSNLKDVIKPLIKALIPKNQALAPIEDSFAMDELNNICYAILLQKHHEAKKGTKHQWREVSIVLILYRVCYQKLKLEETLETKILPDGQSIDLLRNILQKTYISYYCDKNVLGFSGIRDEQFFHGAFIFTVECLSYVALVWLL